MGRKKKGHKDLHNLSPPRAPYKGLSLLKL